MRREPPALATTLFRCLVANDSLDGDLREAYAQGKSAWWYWRQVLSAIIVGGPRRSVLVVRGLVFGWIVLRVCGAIAAPISRVVMGGWVLDWMIVHLGSHPFVMLWATQLWWRPVTAATYLVCGWLVARTHARSADIILAVLMAPVLIASALSTVEYLVTQHRAYGHVAYPNFEIAFTMLPFLLFVGGWLATRSYAHA